MKFDPFDRTEARHAEMMRRLDAMIQTQSQVNRALERLAGEEEPDDKRYLQGRKAGLREAVEMLKCMEMVGLTDAERWLLINLIEERERSL